MYILDTDIVSLLHAGHPRIGERKGRVSLVEIATTIISKIEILQARYDFLMKARDGEQLQRAHSWLVQSERDLGTMQAIAIDPDAAREFDRLLQNKKLRKIGRADLLIASIAVAKRATLVTRNLRHCRQIPGLRLENWAD